MCGGLSQTQSWALRNKTPSPTTSPKLQKAGLPSILIAFLWPLFTLRSEMKKAEAQFGLRLIKNQESVPFLPPSLPQWERESWIGGSPNVLFYWCISDKQVCRYSITSSVTELPRWDRCWRIGLALSKLPPQAGMARVTCTALVTSSGWSSGRSIPASSRFTTGGDNLTILLATQLEDSCFLLF